MLKEAGVTVASRALKECGPSSPYPLVARFCFLLGPKGASCVTIRNLEESLRQDEKGAIASAPTLLSKSHNTWCL